MSYNALYSKYRPQTLSDIVGQDHIVRILHNGITKNKLSHAYLFFGIRGTGKTTIARILAKYVNCLDPQDGEPCNVCDYCVSIMEGRFIDVEEIDAASNRGINEARDLRERVRLTTHNPNAYRVVIIDEAHQLTSEASQALLKTFEEPPENTMFILCTTEPNAILDTIRSRCQCLSFRPVPTGDIQKRMLSIANSEGWGVSEDILHLVASLGNGSVRDAISQLEKVANCLDEDNNIDTDDAYMLLGVVDKEQAYNYMLAMLKGDISEVFKIINYLVIHGNDLSMFVRDVMILIKDIICVRACQGVEEIFNRSDKEKEQILVFSKKMKSLSLLGHILSTLEDAYINMDSVKNLPSDIIMVESSMRIIAKIMVHEKKGD